MEDVIKEQLLKVIKKELANISELPSGTKEKTAAVEDLTKLYKLKIEDEKLEVEMEDKNNKKLLDEEQVEGDKIKILEQKKDRWLKFGVDVGAVALPFLLYWVWMGRGFKYEETGSYTSRTLMNLFSRFKPTR